MERRKFFSSVIAGVAGIALDQAIPLGRVWSFPRNLVVPKFAGIDLAYTTDWSIALQLRPWQRHTFEIMRSMTPVERETFKLRILRR